MVIFNSYVKLPEGIHIRKSQSGIVQLWNSVYVIKEKDRASEASSY